MFCAVFLTIFFVKIFCVFPVELMTIHIEIKEAPKVIADKETTVLGIFRQHPDITLQEVADKMGVSLRSIKILIKDLQAQGKL